MVAIAPRHTLQGSPGPAGTAALLSVLSQLAVPTPASRGILYIFRIGNGERGKKERKKAYWRGKKKDISYSAGLGFFNPHSHMLESFFKIPDFQLLHPDKLHFTDSGYKQPIVVQLIFPLEIPHKSLTVLQPGQTPKIQQIKGKVLKLPRWVLL